MIDESRLIGSSLPRLMPTHAAAMALVIVASGYVPAQAYSQFTHEELIDIVWEDSIRPLLLRHYPGASEAALARAHSYAYGGCLLQDVGYYPFGRKYFSDLTHYVRTGDFVTSLLSNAGNINELSFALGAILHYV